MNFSKNYTIFKLYKLFASQEEQDIFAQKLLAGLSWGEAKKELFEVMNNYIKPMREKFDYYMSHKEIIDEILKDGEERARRIAKQTLQSVRKAIGAEK